MPVNLPLQQRRSSTWLAALAAVALLAPGVALAAPKQQFKKKDCSECHDKLAKKIAALPHQHEVFKKGDCEACHLRHGVVPKLLLKQTGAELCTGCHAKAKIGLDKPNVHKVAQTGSCTKCHEPHGSAASHLLKAEGAAACYGCHDKKKFERKSVHKVLASSGCGACHAAHGSD